MRYLCLDVGDRWIGVARSDESATLASPVTTIRRTSFADDLRKLAILTNEASADVVVVGLPKNMNGTLGLQAQRTMTFARRLHPLGRKIVLWNEQLSSVTAEEAVRAGRMRAPRRGERLDAYAAAVILQDYLDSGMPPEGTQVDTLDPGHSVSHHSGLLDQSHPSLNDPDDGRDVTVEELRQEATASTSAEQEGLD